MSTQAIAATTDEAISAIISVGDGASVQCHVSPNLGIGEKVTLERSFDGGFAWTRVLDSNHRGVLNTNLVNSRIVNGPGDFRFRKTETAEAVAVYYD